MSFRYLSAAAWATALTLLAAASVHAHVVLEQRSAEAGSTYKAVFQLSHGCQGAATTGFTVHLPAGVEAVRPMPKPGWALEASQGQAVTPGERQVRWRGGPLPDGFYDEFVLQLKLPAQPGPLWFRVFQQCEQGVNDWTEQPASGADTRGLKAPAVLLDVRPSAAHAHPHH